VRELCQLFFNAKAQRRGDAKNGEVTAAQISDRVFIAAEWQFTWAFENRLAIDFLFESRISRGSCFRNGLGKTVEFMRFPISPAAGAFWEPSKEGRSMPLLKELKSRQHWLL
jgi:hypothetical protein